MAWKTSSKSGTRTRSRSGGGDGASLKAPGVSVMTDQQLGMILVGMRDEWSPTVGAQGSVALAILNGEQVSSRKVSESDMMLQASGRRLGVLLRSAVNSGTVAGWEADEFGFTVSGRVRTEAEKLYEAGTETLDAATFGVIDIGDEGGVDDMVGELLGKLGIG